VDSVKASFALGQKSTGHALKELLPALFTIEDLSKGGVEALDGEKVACLVGMRPVLQHFIHVLKLFFS